MKWRLGMVLLVSLMIASVLCGCNRIDVDNTQPSASGGPTGNSTESVQPTIDDEPKGKLIELYLIGGQSNAVGSSEHKGQLPGVYKNVGYAGCCEMMRTGVPSGQYNLQKFYWEVKAGYGGTTTRVGPEYGMAQVLDPYYTGETKAFIFKSAAGATNLLNVEFGAGNWYPRSLWDEGYDPGKTSESMGFQYYWFVENFRLVYNKLVEDGFHPVVKGMAWMQGESDLPYYRAYEKLIKTFITDLRNDLVQITGDESLYQMPFVMGEICTSFDGYNNPHAPKFNAMLADVAAEMENVYVIDTSDFACVDQYGNVVGTDRYHFNWADMEQLGARFANKLVEVNNTTNQN